jgi:hypothetical protein
MPINYGAAITTPSRMAVASDPGDFLPAGDAARKPATDAELAQIERRVSLTQTAPSASVGLAYTPAASHWEITQKPDCARYHATSSCTLRVQRRQHGPRARLLEVIAHSAITGAGAWRTSTAAGRRMPPGCLRSWRMSAHAVDVTTELSV